MTDIFVSYRRQDSAGHAGRLYHELARTYGRSHVFRDLDSIRAGEPFPEALDRHLRQCEVMLVLIGPRWIAARDDQGRLRLEQPGDFVRQEIGAALARDDVRVVPVLIDGGRLPPADDLPEELRGLAFRQAIELRDSRWDDDVANLIDDLGVPPLFRRLSQHRWTRVAAGAAIGALVLVVSQWPSTGGDGASGGTDASGSASETEPSSTDPSPEASPTAALGEWRINFQKANAPVPEGYLVDFGQPFGDRTGPDQGSGLRYGWVEPGTGTPTDMTAHARDRDAEPAIDQRLDTLMHFRNLDPATGEIDLGSWEIELPDGDYLVTVSVGDVTTAQTHTVIAEDVPLITDFQGDPDGMRYEENTATVTVDDGRLTLATDPDQSTKINYVEIVQLP